MISLVEYLNEALNKQNKLDLEACVSTVLQKLEFDEFKNEKEFINALSDFIDDRSDYLYNTLFDIILDEYDFSQEDLEEELEDVINNVAQKLLADLC